MQESIDTRWYGLGSSVEMVKLQNVSFREYQFNIARKVFEGMNTLVILPTGLGKTLIGTLAIANAIQKGKKALILAPTKPLSEQHHSVLRESLSIDGERILLLTGALAKSKRREALERADVIVATPQTFANELKKGEIDMGDFCLAIFDECHKAVGKYAYTYIADECDLKGVQMLGLTASPGSSKEKIKKLVNALKIEDIQIRISTDPDVVQYVMPKHMHVVEVDKSPTINRIASMLRPIAEDSLGKLRGMGLTQFQHFESMPKGRLIEMGNMISRIQAQNFKFGALHQYSKLLNLIHAYDLLETEGLYAFTSYIDSLKAREKKGKAVLSLLDNTSVIAAEQLAKAAMAEGEEHPKVSSLISIIGANLGKSMIVFVQYRSTIKMLVEMLNKNGVEARAFVGKKDGVTQEHQKQTISDFREGKFRILVSSSIGEEGLDIPSVDLVVFYEPIPSEIRNIQRRGRTGRLYKGEVYLLVTRQTKDQVYLMVSRQREGKMLEVVDRMRHELASKRRPEKQSRLA
ncbi:MAG: DEAD/DEAH box helicase [Candidatus Micrarchaeota archaeon]|nr:DEAD/DEAH box helicase [Candidatus Micrarchaeota archaeon]MDE1804795.1 DEAD/DEAH box helicase [Candidatus Micrarchaeota archaeon]MDE1847186.1 DEAD/DEAH box helicase [Candidatus Micrarchaeota archaeon]